ncbi:MAG: glutathione S-transferase family protein [Pseudomonadota bacterium]
MKIISFKICPFVQRVTALLEAKGLDYEIDYIDLNNKPLWFLDLSPHGQVPILVTGAGSVLFESEAIMEYIDDVTPALESNVGAEQRAVNRAWSYLAAKNYLVQCSTMRSTDAATFQERVAKLNKAFATIENALADGPYFNGEELGNVDIAWTPLLHRADIVRRHTGFDFFADYPKLRQWQAALLKREFVQTSVAADFEQKFVDFYLSANTCLGRGLEEDQPVPVNAKTSACC